MTIPSKDDWVFHPLDPDAAEAYQNFYGKTLTEAFALFEENALYYQEDIMFMPVNCFRYYVHSYIDYLLSDLSKGNSDGANCFFGIVEIRNEDIKSSSQELRDRIREVLQHLGARQNWFEALPEVYGDFRKRSEECLNMIDEQNQNNNAQNEEKC